MTVLAFGDQPELYGLPRDPTVPLAVRLWKGPLKWLGNLAMLGGLAVAAAHYVRFGRKRVDGGTRRPAPARTDRGGSHRVTARRRSIVRYDFRERLVHAIAALSYVYLLLTGLAFWTPALYWLAIVLGGGYLSRLLHPWVGVFFTAVVS